MNIKNTDKSQKYLCVLNSILPRFQKTFKLRANLILGIIFLIFGASVSANAATFTVTKTADTNDGLCDSDCSLREAIAASNSVATDDVIEFDSITFNTAQTITLNGTRLSIKNNGSIAINGTGTDKLTISGNNISQVLEILTDSSVVITKLTIANGKALENPSIGGGIINYGKMLTLNEVIVRNNSAKVGGGIISSGKLIVNNSSFYNNTGEFQGGAISNSGTVEMNNSIINDNSSPTGGGIVTQGSFTLTNSIVSNSPNGGGVYIGAGTIFINNSTISGNAGGGIRNVFSGNTIVENSIIDSNYTKNNNGGGIYVVGTVTVSNTIISNNSSNRGGGILCDNGTVDLEGVSIRGNTSLSLGGGFHLDSGSSKINNTTFSGNSALLGGGLSNSSGSELNMTNSTVSGNSAVGNVGNGGGGNFSGIVNLDNVTIANNISNNGGGISTSSGPTNIHNTIIADNSATYCPEVQGKLSSTGFNIIENTNCLTVTGDTNGNITGVDPQLLPLGNYGGSTLTHALSPSSPAVDAADPNNFPEIDQRGIPRPKDGNGDSIVRADIGAFEVRAVPVTNINDNGAGSLRQAITDAGMQGDAVIFSSDLFNSPQTIVLTGGELTIPASSNFVIAGKTADQLTISGNNQSRVVFVNEYANLTLIDITITNGNGTGQFSGVGGGIFISRNANAVLDRTVVRNNSTTLARESGTLLVGGGGGIYNSGNLILKQSKLTDNKVFISGSSAGGGGGGLYNFRSAQIIQSSITNNSAERINNGVLSNGGGIISSGNLDITGSTISYNTAQGNGGGVSDGLDSVLNINNSTISNNAATTDKGVGGGIYSFSTLNMSNSTVASNSADNIGGGVLKINNGSKMFISKNSIYADNTAAIGSADFSGRITSQGFNLIETVTGETMIDGDPTGNITGVDPQLLPLGNYGGLTQTHALRRTSPAIDKGNSFGINTDQRRFSRPFDFPNISNASGGDGSDIGAFERQTNDAGGSVRFDFDGDGKTDISVFRPVSGGSAEWYYLRSSDGVDRGFPFGLSSDRITPADFTGDGKTDIAFFRPSTGFWFVLRSEDGSFFAFPFGTIGDIPAPGDFDGDGTADAAVFRPSIATWFIRNSSDGSVTTRQFGATGDVPIVEDYDGDGKDDIAVYRPSVSEWYLQRSTAGFIGFRFGAPNDTTPVPADFTGDGKADIAFFAKSTNQWFVLRSEDSSFFAFPFGAAGDIPAPGDYDGDEKADAAVFRPSNGIWYLNQTANGQQIVSFGANGDRPLPSTFIP